MWAYDANDLLAVKQGTKQPWDVQPYAKWTLPGMPIDGVTNLMRAGYYDPATRRLYVGSTDSHDGARLRDHQRRHSTARLGTELPERRGQCSRAHVLVGAPSRQWLVPLRPRGGHLSGRRERGRAAGVVDATNLTLPVAATGMFYLRLRAVYADGADPPSNEIQVVLGAVREPAPPANFRATAAGSQVTLAWDPVVDSSVSDVIAEVGNGPGLSNLAQGVSIGMAGSYVASNVPAGHYYMRARAVGAGGASAPTNDVEVVVGGGPVPSSPLDLAAYVDGDHSVVLTWRAGEGDETPSQFVVEVGSHTGLANLGTLTLPVSTRFESPVLPSGTYYIRLRAGNANGVSAPSNEVRVVIP